MAFESSGDCLKILQNMYSNTYCSKSGFMRMLYTNALYTEPFVSSCSDISLPILNVLVSFDLFLEMKVVITARG